jgi:hypothetical protein
LTKVRPAEDRRDGRCLHARRQLKCGDRFGRRPTAAAPRRTYRYSGSARADSPRGSGARLPVCRRADRTLLPSEVVVLDGLREDLLDGGITLRPHPAFLQVRLAAGTVGFDPNRRFARPPT